MNCLPLVWQVVLRGAILVISVVLGGAESATAADPPLAETGNTGKTVRLFTVGNSFSGNATRFLPGLAKAGGHTLVLRTASVGGAPLSLHWSKAEAHEKDSTSPAGLYGSKKGLAEELRAEKWDYVTIQQASINSHDPETYRPYAAKLSGYIKANAPGARVLVHQTWAYRVDDKRFTGPAKAGEPRTREEMHQLLTRAYRTIAAELDPAFIARAALPPALPDQARSLHAGWKWSTPKEGKPILQMDGHHASDAGQYLGACVFYEVIYKESVEGNEFVPKGLDPAYAEFLRRTAHKAVEESRG